MKTTHIVFVSMSGLRVAHQSLVNTGMRLPELAKRAEVLNKMPPLGILTLASMLGDAWYDRRLGSSID